MRRPFDDWFECDSKFDGDANLGGHENTWRNNTFDSDRAR